MKEEERGLSAAGQRRKPVAGCGARGGGCFLRIAGLFLVLGGSGHLRFPSLYDASAWRALLTGIAMIAAGAVAVALGARLSRHGRRHTARIIERPEELADNSFVLFLRPFEEDRKLYEVKAANTRSLRARYSAPISRTYEEEIVWSLRRRFGRVVAVGRPGERLPLPGAHRFYLPLDDWQPVVSDLIGRARLVVLVAGTGPGTLWELTEAVRLLPPGQLLLLVFGDEAAYRRFQECVPEVFADRAEELRREGGEPVPAPAFPDYPPLCDPATGITQRGLRGIIHFGPDWTPAFVRYDFTAVRALTLTGKLLKAKRTQLDPVLRRTEQGLPEAVPPRRAGVRWPVQRRRDRRGVGRPR
ncbi:hypothetical protein KBZ10_20230 [Streptomyces sp. F63]|uniref:hypothetical protein n=1 Tax=Streptomyces sp. F63 TaxID=2824887 RepID=UPI001B35DAE0|nr:hypothetical protein [Streptomyces sp. F63]MBQ0986798.1 hypothetical protein [Streptomyces sp. F63]